MLVRGHRAAHPLLLTALMAGALAGQGKVIRADNAPVWGAPTLKSLMTVGIADGAPEYMFSHISMISGAKNGSFFVYDGKDVQVRHYGADGKFLGNVGRKGAGPGEYQIVTGMAVLGDTGLVMWDPRNVRVTWFDLNGKIRNSFRPNMTSFMYGSNIFGIDNSGIISIRTGSSDGISYIRFRPNGVLLDTLHVVTPKGDPSFVLMTDDGERWSFSNRKNIMPSATGGLLLTSPDTLGFNNTVAGKQQTVIRKATQISLTPDERKEWEAYAQYLYDRQKAAPPPPPNVRVPEPALAKIPLTKPLLRTAFTDQDGRVWLNPYVAAEKRELPPRPATSKSPPMTMVRPTVYDIFSSVGQYLGRLTLPTRHEIFDAIGDRIWTVKKGAEGDDVVEVYSIVKTKG